MHHSYWGLNRPPFARQNSLDGSFHEGEVQAEGLARLRHVIQHSRRAALVTGERGCGKSLLLRQFAAECRDQGLHISEVDLDSVHPQEMLRQIASQLALNPRRDDDPSRLLSRLVDWAAAADFHRSHALVLADHADEAGPDVLRLLARCARMFDSYAPCLTLVSACRDENVMRLGNDLLDSIDLRIQLGPWEEADTIAYVQLALLDAGCDRPVFKDHALAVLHTLSGGVPRDVNRLADYAMAGGAAVGCETIDAGIVEAAYDALKPVVVA